MTGCSHGQLGMNAGMDGGGGSEAVYQHDEDFFETFVELVDDEAPLEVIQSFLGNHPGEEKETYEWDKDKYAPVHYAAARRRLDVVKLLIGEEGVDVDIKTGVRGITPLHFAAAVGELDVARYLVDRGADVNAQDAEGSCVLHYATSGGNIDLLKLLIDGKGANADVQEECRGLTILHVALSMKASELAKYIIRKVSKETLNKRTKRGNTALHFAVRSRQQDVVDSLLNTGADATIENSDHKVPYQIARDPDIANMLLGRA